MTTETTIAGTILNQLGGRQFIQMTGAHGILNLGNGLQVKFKGSRDANCVRVVLDADDTYTVTFYKGAGLNIKQVAEFDGVYDSNLRPLFERKTGLSTSLFTRS